MSTSSSSWTRVRKLFLGSALAVCVSGAVRAEGYDFNKFLRGGGGGGDPQQQKIARQSGAYICVDVSAGVGPSSNTVRFFIWSMIPQPRSRVSSIAIDTGRHLDLISNVSVSAQSPGVTSKVVSAIPHAFLHTLTADYWIDFTSFVGYASSEKRKKRLGLAPGNFVMISAILGPNKNLGHVIAALNEGINPATAATGLRIGLIVHDLLGGPPVGVATIMDDGGFVTNAASPRCRRG